jgi:hypothetical protein
MPYTKLRQKIVATLNVFLHYLKMAKVIEAKIIQGVFAERFPERHHPGPRQFLI